MQYERIRTTLDLDAPGKATGRVLVPISTDSSAYGMVALPITVIAGAPGPTVLLTGGVHGDEYEGPILLTRLAREIDSARVAGRLIVVPTLNPPAAAAARRTSPLDGLNLNRVFPGRPDGSASEMIADFVTRVLIARADIVIDLHSGGRSLVFPPLIATHITGDAARDRRAFGALTAFGAPFRLVARDPDPHGFLDYTAEAAGCLVISTELGGGGGVTPAALKIGERGVRRALDYFGVVADQRSPDADPAPGRWVEITGDEAFALAPEAGVYEPLVELGEPVRRGLTLGLIHRLERPEVPALPVEAAMDGWLICRRAPALAAIGDCLAIVAADFTPPADLLA